MATLKIYNDIVGEEDKVFLQEWCGTDGVCFKDIHEFISKIALDDKVIDIRLHCRGGSCVEGWAIYDALRQSGKEISATIDGECSSMATIILLAAPAERRKAMPNSHICIHNPSICWPEQDWPARFTADAIHHLSDQLNAQEKSLRMEQSKILDLYVERTGSDREELQALMNEDIFIDTDRAMALGFISSTLIPNTAKRNVSHLNNPNRMNKVQVEAGLVSRLLARAGFKSLEDAKKAVSLVITTADGTDLNVEREEGDPQVGDTAYPDGTFVTDDGTTIVVEDSLITSITPAAEEPETTEDNGASAEVDVEELQTKVDELTQTVATLQEQVDTLTQENTALNEQVTAKKDACVLSDNEKLILAKVKRAGDMDWLNKVLNARSTASVPGSKFNEGSSTAPAGETKTQKAIREQREAAERKRALRK